MFWNFTHFVSQKYLQFLYDISINFTKKCKIIKSIGIKKVTDFKLLINNVGCYVL